MVTTKSNALLNRYKSFNYCLIFQICTNLANDEFKEVAKDATKSSSFTLANDSWLDTSDSCNVKSKTKNNLAANDDDDDDLKSSKESSYVPVKGQKMAAKRLKQIQGLLFITFGFK